MSSEATKTDVNVPDSRKIIDELCTCGALQSEHKPGTGGRELGVTVDGHGPCKHTDCKQFTWKSEVFSDNELAKSIHRLTKKIEKIRDRCYEIEREYYSLIDGADTEVATAFESSAESIESVRYDIESQQSDANTTITGINEEMEGWAGRLFGEIALCSEDE